MDAARVRLIQQLRLSGPQSKAQLLQATDVTRGTIQGHLDALVAAELLTTAGAGVSRGGRPSATYALSDRLLVLAVQVRSDTLDVALCDLSAQVVDRRTISSDISDGPAATADRIAALVSELSTSRRTPGTTHGTAAGSIYGAGHSATHSSTPGATHGSAPGATHGAAPSAARGGAPRSTPNTAPAIVGIGIGLAGPVAVGPPVGARGTVVAGPFFRNWEGIDFRETLRSRIALPVIIDNDANTAARGELHARGTRESSSYLYVELGESLGSGLLINGEVYRGAAGSAGEIGHVNAVRNGPRCECGRFGCLGQYLNGGRIRERASAGASSGLKAVADADGNVDLDGLATAVRSGDAEAGALVDDCADKLATVLANLVNFVNPDTIVLAGPVARISASFVNDVRAGIYAQALPLAADRLTVEHTLTDPATSGLTGAALLAVDAFVEQRCS